MVEADVQAAHIASSTGNIGEASGKLRVQTEEEEARVVMSHRYGRQIGRTLLQ